MEKNIRVVVVGCGNMGSSHARSYHMLPGFDLVGVVDSSQEKRETLASELGVTPFASLEAAIEKANPEAVAICTYPDTHADFASRALRAGLHVFVEKPVAETVEQAQQVVALAKQMDKKVVVGYILRHHPAWIKFIDMAHTLGKPLVMRMNLNQQSKGAEWGVHKQLMNSMSPIVDCGVHYVDVMCQMTRSKPVRVQAIGTRLSDELKPDMYNYGQLQVIFEDKSVGWYEAGWGPMMSEVAFFVKDVVGPKGCVSIVEPRDGEKADSADIDSHTKTNCLLKHSAEQDEQGNFIHEDVYIDTKDEPGHQELCDREQAFFLKAIQEDLDLQNHLEDAINSLRIVLAADESVRTGKTISL